MEQARWLACMNCHATYPIGPVMAGCTCGGALEVHYEPKAVDRTAAQSWMSTRGDSLWQYRPLLPLPEGEPSVSLGEGQTPLHASETLRRTYGHAGIFLKNEGVNPTWSHKDRYHSVSVSMAKAFGFSRLVTASTGNHGISAAAYAARAGIQCVVMFASETSPVMWQLAGLYGAQAVVTSFDGRETLMDALARRPGWYPASGFGGDGPGDPFGIEGYKTIAYEVIRQLDGAPDLVLVPVGGGNLLYGIWKGFQDARAIGMTHETPHMVACHAAGANVLERALREGRDDVPQMPDAFSVATSTREKGAGLHALRAVRASGGFAISVSEDEILDAVRLLGAEGICAETASAISVASAIRLLRQGQLGADQRIVCIVTSAGVKWPEVLPEVSRPPKRMLAAPADLDTFLEQIEAGTPGHRR
jgi:threonine synthase